MKTIRLLCKDNIIGKHYADIVQQQIRQLYPNIDVVINTFKPSNETSAEVNETLLHIDNDILVYEASESNASYFLNSKNVTIVSRYDTRNVAIFNNTILEKIASEQIITIGANIPHGAIAAKAFLQKALPQLAKNIYLEVDSHSYQIDTLLYEYEIKKVDVVILPVAYINLLLQHSDTNVAIKNLLAHKKIMLLPLVECVPAKAQAAIAIEVISLDDSITSLVQQLRNDKLHREVTQEMQIAKQLADMGTKQYGVTTLQNKNTKVCYASGINIDNQVVEYWSGLPAFVTDGIKLFSSSDYMKDFFDYEWDEKPFEVLQPNVFVANHKSITHYKHQPVLHNKTIFASGTRTWYELAKLGYWVTANADALGFETFIEELPSPLFSVSINNLCIITNNEAALRWQQKSYQAFGNYNLVPLHNQEIANAVQHATHIFWTSFAQFDYYKKYAHKATIHMCVSGETATLIKQEGIIPIIFPTIKSFLYWRKSNNV